MTAFSAVQIHQLILKEVSLFVIMEIFLILIVVVVTQHICQTQFYCV